MWSRETIELLTIICKNKQTTVNGNHVRFGRTRQIAFGTLLANLWQTQNIRDKVLMNV